MNIITPYKALERARKYCVWQERCQSELRRKLYELKQNKDVVENIIATLIEEGFINEERFAISYANGHFRSKGWGKIKIEYELKKRNISKFCIKVALESISNEDYQEKLITIIKKKIKELKIDNKRILHQKILVWCIGKGFESDLINLVFEKKIES